MDFRAVAKVRRQTVLASVCAAVLFCAGCATHRTLELDAQHPAVSVTAVGFKFGDELVGAEEIAEILEDYDVPHDRVIHILLEPEVRDLRPARMLMALLSRAGYTRPVLVTHQHAESENLGKPKKRVTAAPAAAKPPVPRAMRYKRANE